MMTTLKRIREHSPCNDGWKKLLRHLGKTEADEAPLPLLTVLDNNGLIDAVWCFRAIPGFDQEKHLFSVWCARQVQHLMTDQRSVSALDVAESHANGKATDDELASAIVSAYDAVLLATKYDGAILAKKYKHIPIEYISTKIHDYRASSTAAFAALKAAKECADTTYVKSYSATSCYSASAAAALAASDFEYYAIPTNMASFYAQANELRRILNAIPEYPRGTP